MYTVGVVVDYTMESGRMVPELYPLLTKLARFLSLLWWWLMNRLLNDTAVFSQSSKTEISLKEKGKASQPVGSVYFS